SSYLWWWQSRLSFAMARESVRNDVGVSPGTAESSPSSAEIVASSAMFSPHPVSTTYRNAKPDIAAFEWRQNHLCSEGHHPRYLRREEERCLDSSDGAGVSSLNRRFGPAKHDQSQVQGARDRASGAQGRTVGD